MVGGGVSGLVYMELCTCGHIRDEHHDGLLQVSGGCEMCLGPVGVHVFEGTGNHGDMHPGLGHLSDGEWVYDDAWKKFEAARYRRLFPNTNSVTDDQPEEGAP